MFPGKIFTGLAKFQGIVSVKDFRFPIWLPELLQAPLCFLRSFCFARIWLDPLGGQVLHHDCISMIVSTFTTFTENFVICCYQVTKFFCTWYGSANASSARGPCIFGPLTDLAISVFREVSVNTVFTQIHIVGVGSKDGSWEELACESLRSGTLSSTSFSLNSCSHSGMSEWHRSPRSWSWSSFLFLFWIFGWLGCKQRVSSFYLFNRWTWHRHWRGINFTLVSLSRVSLSLDVVVIGEVDELEEDVGWLRSCLERVIDVEEWELDEELDDKPGTTIGTKFSVLHCIRIPF